MPRSIFGAFALISIMLSGVAHAACLPAAKAAIDAKYTGQHLNLGVPTGLYVDLTGSADACRRNFERGAIFTANGRASAIFGGIYAKWNAMRGEASVVGLPVTDATVTPDGVARYAHFERGSIYWRPCLGAFAVYGLIRKLWSEGGWERGALGYPKTDELPTADGAGRYGEFQGGGVYYHPRFGTFAVTGPFRRIWDDKGGLAGLGYPTGAYTCHRPSERCWQTFERGTLDTRMAEYKTSVDLRPSIARLGIGIRDQQNRGTCSVFATTFLLEHAYTAQCDESFANLSEEYLNHVTNLATNDPGDGDFFHNIVRGYETYGIAKEASLPYMPTYAFVGYQLPAGALSEGYVSIGNNNKMNAHFIRAWDGTMGLTDAQMQEILGALRRGIPVGIGRTHSMPAVGFTLDGTQPGGGTMIFRNSYGSGTDDQGYRVDTFADVQANTSDAFYFERPSS